MYGLPGKRVTGTNKRSFKKLLTTHREDLAGLCEDIAARGGSIWVAEVPALLRNYSEKDFALFDDRMALVTEDVVVVKSLSRGLTSGRDGRVIVQGYASWRRADVAMYREFWRQLKAEAVDLESILKDGLA